MSRDAPRRFSFEFFPPKTDAGRARLRKTIAASFAPLRPSFVSVTFGAGGSTREGSFQTASEIIRTTDLDVTPHLSCIGSTAAQIARSSRRTAPSACAASWRCAATCPRKRPTLPRAFGYANELVAFIQRRSAASSISVACYPEFHPEARARAPTSTTSCAR